VLVRRRVPGVPCFTLCHEGAADAPAPTHAELMAFFIAQAESLALSLAGDAQAFVLVHNGAAIRHRANWHLHVFVPRRRWQKAWVYAILMLKSLARAATSWMRPIRPAALPAGAPAHGAR
jgi:hypothetical protein